MPKKRTYKRFVPVMTDRKLKSEIITDTDYLINIRRRPIPFSEKFKRWMGESWINQGFVTVIILLILAIIFNLIGLYK